MQKINIKNSLILLLAAVIWGSSFVSQSVGMDYIGPFTFNGVRSLLGSLVLIPVLLIIVKNEKKKNPNYSIGSKSNIIKSGIICGLIMFIATNCQQIGIIDTASGKTGFITAFYIILVPIFGIFIKRSCPPLVWIGVIVALVGMWFLCMNGADLTIRKSDIIIFICAIFFAIHILVVDHYSPLVNGVLLSCMQFFICGALSLICAFLFDKSVFNNGLDLFNIFACWKSILYSGVLSCGVAYTLQIIGQKDMDPTAATLILSLESCLSVIAGWLILHEHLSGRELFGCLLVFAAVIYVQLVVGKSESKKSA